MCVTCGTLATRGTHNAARMSARLYTLLSLFLYLSIYLSPLPRCSDPHRSSPLRAGHAAVSYSEYARHIAIRARIAAQNARTNIRHRSNMSYKARFQTIRNSRRSTQRNSIFPSAILYAPRYAAYIRKIRADIYMYVRAFYTEIRREL